MEQEDYLISDTNRVENLVDDIIAEGQPDDMFLMLMSILETTELLPQVGRYYTFIYRPKTPELKYDQFPLIACVGVYQWGFKGINYHWGDYKNYTWDEVGNNDLHLVYPMELNDMRSIPYQQFNYT